MENLGQILSVSSPNLVNVPAIGNAVLFMDETAGKLKIKKADGTVHDVATIS